MNYIRNHKFFSFNKDFSYHVHYSKFRGEKIFVIAFSSIFVKMTKNKRNIVKFSRTPLRKRWLLPKRFTKNIKKYKQDTHTGESTFRFKPKCTLSFHSYSLTVLFLFTVIQRKFRTKITYCWLSVLLQASHFYYSALFQWINPFTRARRVHILHLASERSASAIIKMRIACTGDRTR